jgi:hypothetical protein
MSIRQMKVFLAGPDDANDEKEAIEAFIHRWNDLYSDAFGVLISVSDWKKHSSSQMGGHAQEVIIEQALSECDFLFIIFKYRFGTPTTGKYKSGTEHEFDWFKQYKGADKISVYFSSNTPPIVEPEFPLVQAFRKNILTMGHGLTEDYDSTKSLTNAIEKRLTYIVKPIQANPKDTLEFENLITTTKERAKKLNNWENNGLGYYEVIFHPEKYLSNKFSLPELRRRLSKMRKRELDTITPFVLGTPEDPAMYKPTKDGLEFVWNISEGSNGGYCFYLNFRQSGLFYLRAMLLEDRDKEKRAHFFSVEWAVHIYLLSVCGLLLLLEGEGKNSKIKLHIKYEGLDGRKVSAMFPCHIPEFSIEKSTAYENWKTGLLKYETLDMAGELFQRFSGIGYRPQEYKHIADNIFKILNIS